MTSTDSKISEMFTAGAHFGYSKASSHSSVKDYIFGNKNGVQVIDLEKTAQLLSQAQEKIKSVTANGGMVIFVGSKNESKEVIKEAATSLEMPYVTTRWIGGTLTNFPEIKKRINKLSKMLVDREKGEYEKYNKKERLDLDKQIEKLQKHYTGLLALKELPKAIVVVDSGAEAIAVTEANKMNIPVISISNTDSDIRTIEFPIVANDSSAKSISFFINELVTAAKN